jgi:hypothetical protein
MRAKQPHTNPQTGPNEQGRIQTDRRLTQKRLHGTQIADDPKGLRTNPQGVHATPTGRTRIQDVPRFWAPEGPRTNPTKIRRRIQKGPARIFDDQTNSDGLSKRSLTDPKRVANETQTDPNILQTDPDGSQKGPNRSRESRTG